jgi:hypothetical protein
MKPTNRKANTTLRLDPTLLKEAKKVLGYGTYTEAIEETLRVAINNKRHHNILEKYSGQLKNYRSFYE